MWMGLTLTPSTSLYCPTDVLFHAGFLHCNTPCCGITTSAVRHSAYVLLCCVSPGANKSLFEYKVLDIIYSGVGKFTFTSFRSHVFP